jgi:tetratricopeptide (TPR) repeat protein
MLMRYGRLLVHDLRENVSSTTLEGLAPGVAAALLLLPLLLFQGWGWLPVWWLALLFVYMSQGERVGAVIALVLTISLAPLLAALEQRQRVDSQPLLWSGLRTLESAAQRRDLEALLAAQRASPDDRDLAYLVGLQYEKAGDSRGAMEVYRGILRASADDPVALNNLAKLEAGQGGMASATNRLQRVADTPAAARIRGTALYNLSILNLQQFDFDAAAELRQRADDLARRETSHYDSQWSYETPEGSAVSAPVSLGPKRGELVAKLAGASGEPPLPVANLTGAGVEPGLAPRSGAFASRLVAALAIFLLGQLARGDLHILLHLCRAQCETDFVDTGIGEESGFRAILRRNPLAR